VDVKNDTHAAHYIVALSDDYPIWRLHSWMAAISIRPSASCNRQTDSARQCAGPHRSGHGPARDGQLSAAEVELKAELGIDPRSITALDQLAQVLTDNSNFPRPFAISIWPSGSIHKIRIFALHSPRPTLKMAVTSKPSRFWSIWSKTSPPRLLRTSIWPRFTCGRSSFARPPTSTGNSASRSGQRYRAHFPGEGARGTGGV
jgi:hypothetical protein